MSGTAPTPTTRNALIEDAKGLSDLIEKAKVADPQLAGFLLGKSLIASKTPWGVLAGSGIGFLATHYGLACAANSVATNGLTPAQVAQDAASIAGGLAQVFGSLGTPGGLFSTDTIAQWASTAQTAASGVASAANSVATNCWTPEDINLAAGFAAMAGAFIGSYIMRYVTSAPISGLFSRGTTP